MNTFDEQLDKALNTWGAPKEALAEIVASYQNNELGSGNNSSGNTSSGSQSGCECGDSVTALQTQIEELTTSLNETTEKLNKLLNKVYDRSAIYNTSYEHIDPSVVFTTYDFVEKEKALKFTTEQTTYPIGLFCLNGTEATVKFSVRLKATNAEGTGTIKFYLNGAVKDTRVIENIGLEENLHEFYLTLDLLETGNYLETLIQPTASNPIEVSYIKYECYNCTNPTFIDVYLPYSVDYYNNQYYFTDCSNGNAKYAIVPTENFTTLNDITWQDTGVAAYSYRFIGNFSKIGSQYVQDDQISYMYVSKDNYMVLYDTINAKEYKEKVIHAEPVFPRNNEINIINCANSGRKIYTQFYIFKDGKSKSYSYINNASLYYTAYSPRYYAHSVTSITARNAYIIHKMDNTLTFSYFNVNCNLGFGKFMSAYLLTGTPLSAEVYTKVHDYCVKHTIKYSGSSTSSKLASYESEVIGKYDHYFKGVNDDYFVVKDGVWHHYFNTLANENS